MTTNMSTTTDTDINTNQHFSEDSLFSTNSNENSENINAINNNLNRNRSIRSVIAYWILGLTNSYGYVVMLSAAHDILHKVQKENEVGNGRTCNEMSTGVILLADIVPSLIVKLVFPFFPLWINFRMFVAVLASAFGFIIVAMSHSIELTILGVVCTSLSGGLGGLSLLTYTVFFKERNVLFAFCSGGGAAGLLGSITYAGLSSLGFSSTGIFLTLLIVPLIQSISFWCILQNPFEQNETEEIESTSQASLVHNSVMNDVPIATSKLSIKQRMSIIPSLFRYIVPLFLVYLLEYYINQGLFELLYFENTFISKNGQYRWYHVLYQIGVFVSRSSISLIKINRIWFLVLFQFLNAVYFTFDAIYSISFVIYSTFILIFWEGLLGGFAFVNAFYKISKEIEVENREFATGITSLADTIGIAVAGLIAIPVHNFICSL